MTTDPFFLLSLPIPQLNTRRNISLYDCLNLYTETERLEGNNKINVLDKGKRMEVATKQLMFWMLPPILIMTVKRFANSGEKNMVDVEFPLTGLDMSNYVNGYHSENYVYDLYGICNHIGGSGTHGHYTAFVKNANGKWYLFDDQNVSEVDERVIKTNNAYCFFYRKKNM